MSMKIIILLKILINLYYRCRNILKKKRIGRKSPQKHGYGQRMVHRNIRRSEAENLALPGTTARDIICNKTCRPC